MPPKTSGFTERDYGRLAAATQQRYQCVGFEVLDSATLPPRFAIVRHDIDMSVRAALALARIEAGLGIRATYTVLLTGAFYSPFEAETRDVLRGIAALGHDIGLHFDAAWHGIQNEAELSDAVAWEAGILSRLLALPDSVRMFSFHNTTAFTMNCRERHYAGLRNAYAGVLQREVAYTSDSNGYWIHRSWSGLLEEGHDRIQVLTHPEWWRSQDAEPAEKVCRELQLRARSNWTNYSLLLERAGRQNRTGLDVAPGVLARLYGDAGEALLVCWLAGDRAIAARKLWQWVANELQNVLASSIAVRLDLAPARARQWAVRIASRNETLAALAQLHRTRPSAMVGLGNAQWARLRKALFESHPPFDDRTSGVDLDTLCTAAAHVREWSIRALEIPPAGRIASVQRRRTSFIKRFQSGDNVDVPGSGVSLSSRQGA